MDLVTMGCLEDHLNHDDDIEPTNQPLAVVIILMAGIIVAVNS